MRISPRSAISRLALRRPRRICLHFLQNSCRSKATRGFNRARACTRPARSYDPLRDRDNLCWIAYCARDAERGWLAPFAFRRSLLSPHHILPTRSSVTSWARCRLSLVLQGSSYCPSHAMRSLLPPPRLYSHHASSQRSANRDKLHLRWVPSSESSHLRESRSVWQEAEVAPHHSHRDLARAIWRA